MIVLTPIVMAAVATAPVFAPPAPPPLKGGTFACRVMDRAGTKVGLTGELGNWRAGEDRRGVADLRLASDRDGLLSLRTTVSMRPLQTDFSAYDAGSKTVITGTLDLSYGREGRIMLDRRVLDGQGTYTQYVGFCDLQLSTAPRDLR